MNSLWNQPLLGNSILTWLIAFGIVIISFTAIRIARTVILRKFKRASSHTRSTLDDFFVLLAETALLPVLYIGALYLGVSWLTFSAKTEKLLHVLLMVISTFFIIRAITSVLNYLINRAISVREESIEKRKQAHGIIIIINIVIWMLGLVFLINNLGYNITSVITGLGIGGIALALASQTILGDLFNYFVIFFDKPFEIGDFIIVDDKMGVVEYIGVKSTRLRTLSGEQLICSNTNLTSARVHNYKRMEERRVVFTLNVVFDTSTEKIEKVPQLIKKIIESQESTRFDRAHFSGITNFCFTFEVVFYILSADYNLFMDRQQAIYLAILKAFETEKVKLAYPTQTIFLNHETYEHNGANHNVNAIRRPADGV